MVGVDETRSNKATGGIDHCGVGADRWLSSRRAGPSNLASRNGYPTAVPLVPGVVDRGDEIGVAEQHIGKCDGNRWSRHSACWHAERQTWVNERAKTNNLSERFDLSIGKVYASCVTPIALTPSASHLSIVDATWNNRLWRKYAACNDLDTNIFFPVGQTGNSMEQTNLAKNICAGCPVANQCLEFALRTLQDYGVWGGRTEDERRSIRRSRRAAARRAATASAAAAQAQSQFVDENWQATGA